MFNRYEHFMSISHMALIVAMDQWSDWLIFMILGSNEQLQPEDITSKGTRVSCVYYQ